jgi:hypothetical protein
VRGGFVAIGEDGFDLSVPLPPRLTIGHIRNAIDYIQEQAEEMIDLYYEQANVFSGIIGMLGIKALDSFSPYKRHKHPDVAQQRFPDLSLGGRLNPPPKQALESKGSIRPWAIQSHYNHAGWYIIWRYVIDPTKRMKKGQSVAVWRVDLPFLSKNSWKYEGSRAQEGHGGRTHTFGVKNAKERLSRCIVYHAPSVALSGGRPTIINGATRH